MPPKHNKLTIGHDLKEYSDFHKAKQHRYGNMQSPKKKIEKFVKRGELDCIIRKDNTRGKK